jgi:hypothetical protein
MMRSILHFHLDRNGWTPDAVKYKVVGKFEPKVLILCAISETCVSISYKGSVKGQAIDIDVYIIKCLPKMVKFIEKHHKNDETIFWPDVASCHYAKKTLEWIEQEKSIKIMPKADNPPPKKCASGSGPTHSTFLGFTGS